MNKIYKVIWSKVKNQYVVVSELAHSNGKQSRTSRNSIRSRIAALVVCGAIAAFGVFSALPTSSAFAAAAETTSGQYIAVAFAKTDTSQINRWEWHDENCTKFNNDYEWDNRTSTWVKVTGDTREFEDAKGIPHTYKLQTDSKTNKDYWVRDGYSITIENDSRFTAYDQYGKPIAPENTYIIDSQKSDSADSEGLLSSSQVVISDDSKHTTLTGNELNSIDPGIYGGASNSGGTSVPSTWNYYINDNGEGWKDVGGPSDIANMSNFEEVHQQDDGTYNTKQNGSGITVSSDNLYVINGKLGAFFNSNGTVYTGEVYGHNNEVLMTGVENGTYYSYWGTEINDLNTSLSEMTVGDLKEIVGGINDSIYTAQGDDIKKIDVAKAKDGNGGTIGLVIRGDWKSDGQGNGQYVDTDPVPGTITIKNPTTDSGTNGKDVKIQFGSINEEGTDVPKFTVDAGSKVEGLNGTKTATDGDTLTGIKINGEEYKLGGGETYTAGNGIAIDKNDKNKISVVTGNGLEFADDDAVKVKAGQGVTVNNDGVNVNVGNGLKLDGNNIAVNTGSNLEIVDGQVALKDNVDLGDSGSLTTGNVVISNDSVRVGEKTYITSSGLDANNQKITNVADGTIEEGSQDAINGGQLSKYVAEKATYTAGKGINIENNKVSVDAGNGLEFADDDAVKVKAGQGVTVNNDGVNVNVGNGLKLDGNNIAVNTGSNLEIVDGQVALKDNVDLGDSGSLTTGNVVISNDSVRVGEKTYITSSGLDANNQKITNVADGTIEEGSQDAINGGQLYATNQKVDAGWTATDGTNDIKVNPKDGTTTLKFAGDKNISVTADKASSTINVELDPTLEVESVTASKDVVTIDGNKTYSLKDIGYNTQAIKYAGNHTAVDGILSADKIQNENRSFMVEENGNITAGKVKVYATTGEVTGLSNTTWDGTTNNVTRAATEGQLQDAVEDIETNSYKGWTVSANGKADNKAEVASKGNVDFSNTDGNIIVGQDGTNLTFDLNDNIILGDESGTRIQLNGNPQSDSMISITNKDSDTVFNIAKDGTVHSDGDIVAKADSNKKYSLSEVGENAVRYNENKSTVALAGTNGTTITNVADGDVSEGSKEAVNGSQLYATNQKVDAGWVATDGTNKIEVNPTDSGTTTLNFAGDNNITVTADTTNKAIQVALNDKVYLGGDHTEDSRNIVLDGERGVIGLGSNIALDGRDGTAVIGGVNITTTAEEGTGKPVSTITGLSNTTWDTDKVVIDRAATEGQLQMVSDKVTAGWTATDDAGNKINVNPETRPTLNFASGKNITVSANEDSGEVEVSLNDNINLNNRVYINGDPEEGNNTIVDIKSSDTSKEESIFAVEDKGNGSISIGGIDITNVDGPYLAVGDGKLKFYKDGGLSTGNATGTFSVRPDGDLEISGKNSSFNVDAETGNVNAVNSSGSAIMMNDDSVALNASGNGVAISDEGILLNTNGIDEDIKLVTKGTSVSVDNDGATFTNTNTNETTNIDGGTINVGDRLVVDQNGTTTIAYNDGSVMGNNTTMTVNKDGVSFSAYGNGTTVIDGQTISAGGVVINNNGSGTINGLTNTTWDDELAKQVANSEELQGTAATQGQLQQAVSEVAEVANAGWNAKAGGNTINVKPNETLNFEGDGNITVSATGGTSNELKFGLNDNITLGDKAGQKTSTSLTLYTDPTLKEVTRIGEDGNPETVKVTGYIPESYIDDQERIDNFISTHGGFMMYATNTSGEGVFGITTDGMVHAKDVISYMPNSDSTSKDKILKYSLNDIGDIVTQIAHGQYDKTGMEYTLISDFSSQADKDKPFQPEEGERTIGLAVREDGAVVVGAVVNEDGYINDSGIRINAEKRINKDGTTSSDNIATITGLENTTWTPPEPEQSQIATFADDTPKTSRAATEAQLNDLYGTVVGYNVDTDGVNYGTVTLGGGRTSYDKDTHEGGTVLNNVAYASGKDGSEAVNVDYLKDAISDAAENGSISTSDQHLVANTETGSNGVYKPNDDGNVNLIVSDEKGNSSTITIGDVASKEDLDNLKDDVGDLDYSKVEGDTIIDGDSVTTAIGKLDNKIENISGTATDADNNTVTGGKINSDGTISLTQKDKDSIKLEGQLTDSGVVQEGTSFDKETGTITITSQDKYSGETSSVKVEGIASTEVVGATNKEDLATAYKDADKDGNATTEYITDSESMVEADVALDHAIQDVANTSYANDMVLSNRIDSVEKRLGNVEERIDKVGAMAAAIANLRTMGFDPEAPTEIAIGVGQYKSETGIAIGVFHYPNQDFMLSASLSSSGDELMGGIGATWKLGRKSAAERAKDEEARHLEQAEEMKKLAQQEKVKAQAQRHAKLLAERQQASQKNA